MTTTDPDPRGIEMGHAFAELIRAHIDGADTTGLINHDDPEWVRDFAAKTAEIALTLATRMQHTIEMSAFALMAMSAPALTAEELSHDEVRRTLRSGALSCTHYVADTTVTMVGADKARQLAGQLDDALAAMGA